MKNLKKMLLYCLLVFAVLCPVAFGIFKINQQADTNSNAKVVTSDMFNYISITRENHILTTDNIIEYEGASYIVANGSLTINLHPLEYNYQVNLGTYSSNFIKSTQSIRLEKDAETNTYPNSFDYDGKTYYFVYNSSTQVVNVYKTESTLSAPIISSNRTTEFAVQEIVDTLIFTITKSYTFMSSAPDSVFSFTNVNNLNSYELHLLRPKVNFSSASNPVIMFNTFKKDDYGNSFPETDVIEREQQYSKMQINFVNNTYSEENPLYFNINYNGFIFSFELYSKEYDGQNLLFVNYFDDNNSNNDKFLATGLALSGDSTFIPTNNLSADSEIFSLIFNNTGRYGFEIYDSTYICGMKDSNYYSTSFYIVDENSTSYENLYMIAQTVDENHEPLEYIVSTSTLNYSIELTIKNLTNLKTDENLTELIDNIEVIKAIFGASNNEPIHTIYSPAEISNMIDDNGDLNFYFDDDAYYEIYIYPKDKNLTTKKYSFTIVKQAKTSMTIEGEKFEATEPFKTVIKNYSFNINSPVGIMIKFTTTSPTSDTILNKTYKNNYQIKYGMQQVSIVRQKVYDGEGNEITSSMILTFRGVGDLTVTIEGNGKTNTYILNSEQGRGSVTITEYGTYTVRMVDSMGTETAGVFNFAKGMNTSALVLIILCSLLALFIIVFILIARSKIKTR